MLGLAVPQESWAFAAFRESLDAKDTRAHGDDVDLGALMHLRGEERQRAEDLLLERLASDPTDSRLGTALVQLDSQRAVEPLRKALAQVRGSGRVRTAESLAKLDPGFDPVPHYLEVLAGKDGSGRSTAAIALEGRSDPGVIDALVAALEDESWGTRASIFGALVESMGLGALQRPPLSRLRELGTMVMSTLPSVAGEATSEVKRIVRELRAGQPPEALGLTDLPGAAEPEIKRFFSQLGDRAQPDRDFEGLESLAGAARRFVESMLLCELQDDEPRIPRALARIGTERAVAGLEEALALSLPRSAGDTARALQVLRERQGAG